MSSATYLEPFAAAAAAEAFGYHGTIATETHGRLPTRKLLSIDKNIRLHCLTSYISDVRLFDANLDGFISIYFMDQASKQASRGIPINILIIIT